MMSQGFQAFRGKRVLLLQGPVGPFFANLALDLRGAGAQVFKVNFNGGDWWSSPSRCFSRVFNYRGRPADWPGYFRLLVQRLGIDTVLLFGDCRPVHVGLAGMCAELGIELGVFEEGYLRPNHITLERGGVNDNSAIPADPKAFLPYARMEEPAVLPLGSTFGAAAFWAMAYFLISSLCKPFFWHYRHHRQLGFLDGLHWIRSYWRRRYYSAVERGMQERLCGEHDRNFFLVALQLSGDAQVNFHSDYERIEDFIIQVARSFAAHASAEKVLVFKHHPLDRGYSDYRSLIERLTQELNLQGRCFYIHDQHLPTLLDHALGVVTINSTVGLSALGHGCAVKTCGRAIYDLQGLTFQGKLDEFWQFAHLHAPGRTLLRGFRNYLLTHNQHNGSFYKKIPGQPLHCGVIWHRASDEWLASVRASQPASDEHFPRRHR